MVFMILGKRGETWNFLQYCSHKSCIPRIDISNEVLSTSNEDHMQKLRPQEVDVLTYPNGAHMNFGASSPRVRFLGV
jgi:hypothetical protein